MSLWVVYRHGWDSANQNPADGLPETMAVARVEADTAEAACRLAAASVTVTPRQYLTAEPAAIADARENELNLKPEALEERGEPEG